MVKEIANLVKYYRTKGIILLFKKLNKTERGKLRVNERVKACLHTCLTATLDSPGFYFILLLYAKRAYGVRVRCFPFSVLSFPLFKA